MVLCSPRTCDIADATITSPSSATGIGGGERGGSDRGVAWLPIVVVAFLCV